MKRIVLLSLTIICLCTACGKTSSHKSEQEEWEEVYAYETPFVFSQERIENGVEYIDSMDSMVDEAVKTIRERMQTAHDTRDWDSGVWTSWGMDDDKEAFDGMGFYISKIPITEYNNNRNRLLYSFTLFIFNEDMSVTGAAIFGNLNSKKLSVSIIPDATSFGETSFAVAKEKPGMEFINIHANYLRDTPISNPNLLGGIQPYAYASYPLGEDNKVYRYDKYSDNKVKELNTLGNGEKLSIEGDVFHSLPEEMRYSYDKIMDNLIWVEYKN